MQSRCNFYAFSMYFMQINAYPAAVADSFELFSLVPVHVQETGALEKELRTNFLVQQPHAKISF